MCRLFALAANRPTRIQGSLLTAPYSLQRQSCCDRRGMRHDSGWGVATYSEDQPQRVRSVRPAPDDPLYRATAESLAGRIVLAHVRLASAGIVAERNTHPFQHGRWLFAHNGTLFGFAARPDPLLHLLPEHWRRGIEGTTDSEHAFALVLAQLEQLAISLDRPLHGADIALALSRTVRLLDGLYPGEGTERSQMNFVLTDGRVLVASRCRHSLFWLERHGRIEGDDQPLRQAASYQALALASEPTTDEAWRELPDQSVFVIDEDLTYTMATIR